MSEEIRQKEHARWVQYMTDRAEAKVIEAALELSGKYADYAGHLMPLPRTEKSTSLYDDVEVLSLEWNTKKYYIEISITPDGKFEWFFRDTPNRITKLGSSITTDLLTFISLFDLLIDRGVP